jgi:hypothetical protein
MLPPDNLDVAKAGRRCWRFTSYRIRHTACGGMRPDAAYHVRRDAPQYSAPRRRIADRYHPDRRVRANLASMTSSHALLPALLIVDAANVIGSVPDGWWRDRPAAAARLRDGLAPLAGAGLAGVLPELAPPLEVVMVVEGATRGVPGRSEVRVVEASGVGDDEIVDMVRVEVGRRVCAVATADRELRARVVELGALVVGPRHVHPATKRPG